MWWVIEIYDSGRFAVPFALSRVAVAIQNIGNGVVINELHNPDVISAAPIMFMVYQLHMGAARGAFSVINSIVGSLNGQGELNKIGPAVNQGLLMATAFGIPTSVLFFISEHWLPWFATDAVLVAHASQYLRALSYGILPTYWSAIDQQFLLAIKRTVSPIALNTLWVVLSMAIGYPLMLNYANVAWLGYGISISAMITFLVGRLYLYLHMQNGTPDRLKYNIFTRNTNSGTSHAELVQLSIPTMLQAISEWLPTTLIAILSAQSTNGKSILSQEQPSMQVLLVLIQILLGLGTAASVSVANTLGKARGCDEGARYEDAVTWVRNARMIGYAELIVTTFVALPPALFCALYPQPIVKLFLSDAQEFSHAESMLRITGATLILDGVRNTATGALLGKKCVADNLFTSITNLIITSAAATALGYVTQNTLGAISFFIFRMIGIFLNGALLLHRWNARSHPDVFPFASQPQLVAPAGAGESGYPKFH